MQKIKAVIFDWGGVLIDDPAPGLMKYCADALGVTKEKYIEAHRKFAPHFQTGKVSEDKFWNNICNELKVPRPKCRSLWYDAFKTVYSPKDKIFALAGLLRKAGYKTAVLSNTEKPAMKYFHQLYPPWRKRHNVFDVKVFSCAEGIRKPDKKIYRLILRKLKVKPHQAVFIDDRKDFLAAAKKVGLKTILFKSTGQVKAGLKKLGVKTG